MIIRKRKERRSGAAVVEAAIVLPVLLLLLYGIISGAIMVFTVDEVASATREGARYASVRGEDYAYYTKKPAATADEISDVVKNSGVILEKSRTTCTVTWQSSNRPGNYVTVETRYQWPGMGPFPAREFVSRSTQLVSY